MTTTHVTDTKNRTLLWSEVMTRYSTPDNGERSATEVGHAINRERKREREKERETEREAVRPAVAGSVPSVVVVSA